MRSDITASARKFRSPVVIVGAGLVIFHASAANDRVRFPDDYAGGVHYATVTRGGIREELFVSRRAIDAAKAGNPLPDGTVITMEDYRNDNLHRYVVMEKRSGWGAAHPEHLRVGDWEFREFRPDRSPNLQENGSRCMACHQPQASSDFVFTLDQMKSAP